jgi:endonuclease/exonuclease/phosphatase family metal-dependent hydrolase
MQVQNLRLCVVSFALVICAVANCQPIAGGKSGQELINVLRAKYRPDATQSYKIARQQLFSQIDNRHGKVRCVYTGIEIATAGIPNGSVMNTEHTWPQSKFNQRSPMKSDLHHLFATLSQVNNRRGNNPFGEIDDTRTQRWWHSASPQTGVPEAQIDEYSESTATLFEPREDHKGNVARAIFYFWTVYGDDNITADWITPQLDTLKLWHLGDPVDLDERQRNIAIESVQGNLNPFILDETLVARVLDDQFSPVPDSPPVTPLTPFAAANPNAPRPSPARVPNRPELVAADNLRIVTWNARELFNVEMVEGRRSDLQAFAQEATPDILFLQEVTSIEVVNAIRDEMGLNGFFTVSSDFAQDDHREFESLEVGIISRFPLDQVIEFDPSPDNRGDDEPDEASLPMPLLRLGVEPVPTDRGFLWARIDQIRTTVAVVHLKSSRGKIGLADEHNAEEREFVTAAVAAGVNEDRQLLPGYTFMVAGDFNVGCADEGKLGIDLSADCLRKDCSGADRYDETHALLSEGLIGGLRMRNLTLAIAEATFVGGFQQSGPIDNIYVEGALRDRFADAVKAHSSHGSDHFAVWSDLGLAAADLSASLDMTHIDVPQRADAAGRSFAPIRAHTADKLRICSFNIQFLGNSKVRDNAALAGILSDYDVVAIQEMVAAPVNGTYPDGTAYTADPESQAFFDEMQALGFDYLMSDEDTGTGEKIHTAASSTEWWIVFFNPDRVLPAVDIPRGFLADDRSNHPDYERVPYAFPLRSIDGELDFVLIPVHLMPGAGQAKAARRKHELLSIAAWIDDHDDSERDFIILGDMNIEDEEELAEVAPRGFISLNYECVQTNTNINGPKPYDHVLFRTSFSPEIDTDFGFQVVDLAEAMKPYWSGTAPYPGDSPYNHNEFRKYYSDHSPVVSQITLGLTDDD